MAGESSGLLSPALPAVAVVSVLSWAGFGDPHRSGVSLGVHGTTHDMGTLPAGAGAGYSVGCWP